MNNNEKRGKYIWWIFLPVIISFAIQTVIQIVIMEVWFVYKMATYNPDVIGSDFYTFIMSMYDDILSSATNIATLILYAIMAGLLFVILYFRWFRDRSLFSLFNKSQGNTEVKKVVGNWTYFIAGMLVFSIAASYLSTYLLNGLAVIFPDWLTTYLSLLEANGISDTISGPMLVYALVLAPIVEEIAYRGIVFKSACKVMSWKAAIVISALMFGAMHLNWLQASYAFVLGLGLAYAMYLYDNLWVTIALHMAFNILGSIASGLLPTFSDTYFSFFIGLLLSLVAAYAGLLLLKKGAPEKKVDL